MILRIYVVAFISISCISLGICKNSDNVTDTFSDTSKSSKCENCSPPVLTKGQKWIATEKNLKNLISDVSKNMVQYLDPEDASKLSPKCFSSIMKISVGIRQLKMWAFQFLDTMGKIPEGLGRGSFSALGDFDACLAINVSGEFHGKSCMLEIIPPLPAVLPRVGMVDQVPELENHFPSDSVIGSINRMLKPQYEKFVIRLSLCVPSTCTQNDVKFMADKVLEITNVFVGFDVNVPFCQVKEELKIENWDDYTAVIVIGLLIILVTSSTLMDVVMNRIVEPHEKENSRILIRILLCFSMYRNTEKLLKDSKSSDSLSIFNGMRVVSMLWIMLCHTFSFIPLPILYNAAFIRDSSKELAIQIILNGYPAVDTFFFIGGTVLMYSWMKSKQRKLPILIFIFRRYWRLTLPMMLVIALNLLVYRAGSGPSWPMVYGYVAYNCHQRWWTNMMLINNFYGYDQACGGWMWYVAADMQLYLFSLVILLTIKKYPKLSLCTLAVLCVVSIAAIAINQVYYDLPPIHSTRLPTIGDMIYFSKYSYFRPHLHAIVYFTGMAVGYALQHKSKIRISTKINIIGWSASFMAGIFAVYSTYIWYNVDEDPSVAVSATYHVIHKVLWTASLAWVTISCSVGNGGFITKLLSWPAFTPLARLTYIIYLVHPVIQIAYYASSRVPYQVDYRTIAFAYLSFVMAASIAGYFLSMLFEAPFMQIEKMFLPRSSSNKSEEIDENSKPDLEKNDSNNIEHQVNNLSLKS